jgi:hypothetical protein
MWVEFQNFHNIINHFGNELTTNKPRLISCRNKKLSTEIVNSTIDVYTKGHIVGPLSLICCTFMPNIDEARLIGMKMKARTATVYKTVSLAPSVFY